MQRKRSVRITAALAGLIVLPVALFAARGLASGNRQDRAEAQPSPSAKSVSGQKPATPTAVEPLAGIERVLRLLNKEPDPNEERRLDAVTRRLRESVESGWRPPWSDLEIQMTDEQIASASTETLAKACFASGLPARTFLLSNSPNAAIRRLEVLYRGYAELFGRADAWKVPIAVIDLYASALDPRGQAVGNVNAIMGLTTLPELYGYPSIRKSMVGHEKEIIVAHIRGLERISTYLAPDLELGEDASQPFFSVTAPITLVRWALALGRRLSVERYEQAYTALSEYRWLQGDDPRRIRPFLDRAVKELRRFIE